MAATSLTRIALVGNPNAGKTSVFNRLTGLNQHVGNFSGVTVDIKTANIALSETCTAQLIDLPGTYSLYPNSIDEKMVLDVLLNAKHDAHPDAIVYVADASHLERHLLLLTQLRDVGFPIVLAINMLDLAQAEGLQIDIEQLQRQLSIPIVVVNGRTGEGISQLKKMLCMNNLPSPKIFFNATVLAEPTVKAIRAAVTFANDYQALLAAHHVELMTLVENDKNSIREAVKKTGFSSLKSQVAEVMKRYEVLTPLVKMASKKLLNSEKESFTTKVDKILTHPVIGSFIFLGILLLMFQAIFAWAEYPMTFIEETFVVLVSWTKANLPDSWLTSLLADGVMSGLGGVLVFIPQIAILSTMVAILEESGYMTRAVFLSDGIMRRFGLNGRSVVSLISGAACAIPAIMSTRTIGNWKERLITIMVTPLISCSARIPVFTVLVAFVVPPTANFLGIFNMQGLVVLGLYLLGAAAALFSAFVFKLILKTDEQSFLVMELPIYQKPQWKNVMLTVWEKVRVFVLEAGKVIMIISVALWFLASYAPANQMEEAETMVRNEYKNATASAEEIENAVAAKKIEASYAGHLGKFIEPAIEPLGFDWKIGIALITSFAAREVFVGTMATIYSIGSTNDEKTVSQRMAQEKNAKTGQMVYTPATAASLLIFYLFAMQCMGTLAVVRRETKSWKWAALQFIYMGALAYFASWLTFMLFQ